MKFTALQPEWVRDLDGKSHARDEDLDITTAQGVLFLCPRCYARNGGPVGTHSVLAWFRDRGVPDDRTPGPGRWTVTGSGFDDITLSPSVDLTDGGRDATEWHGYVAGGEVSNA